MNKQLLLNDMPDKYNYYTNLSLILLLQASDLLVIKRELLFIHDAHDHSVIFH